MASGCAGRWTALGKSADNACALLAVGQVAVLSSDMAPATRAAGRPAASAVIEVESPHVVCKGSGVARVSQTGGSEPGSDNFVVARPDHDFIPSTCPMARWVLFCGFGPPLRDSSDRARV